MFIGRRRQCSLRATHLWCVIAERRFGKPLLAVELTFGKLVSVLEQQGRDQ
jgi:hypothetical protein